MCLIAVVMRQADHETYETCLIRASDLHLSAVRLVELGVVGTSKHLARIFHRDRRFEAFSLGKSVMTSNPNWIRSKRLSARRIVLAGA